MNRELQVLIQMLPPDAVRKQSTQDMLLVLHNTLEAASESEALRATLEALEEQLQMAINTPSEEVSDLKKEISKLKRERTNLNKKVVKLEGLLKTAEANACKCPPEQS